MGHLALPPAPWVHRATAVAARIWVAVEMELVVKQLAELFPPGRGAPRLTARVLRQMEDRVAPQTFPITQQFRDLVEQARQTWHRSKGVQEDTAEQVAALRLVAKDTLTNEEILSVASAFHMSADSLLELTNNVREVGAAGGPG